MAIVWTVEQPRERGGSGKRKDGYEWERTFHVRTDSLTESMLDVAGAPGIAFGDAHPDDATTVMDQFDVKVADGTGLLYAVTLKYKKYNPAEENNPENPEQPEYVGGLPGKPPIWGGSSSVTKGPVQPNANNELKDKHNNNICNSAGDPLEGLEQEFAEERLTLTQFYLSHDVWMPLSRDYTNAVNDALWNGGAALTWKCQGCSKKLNIENVQGETLVYWELTWEFAYRADKWTLKPWDIGFAQLCDDEGNPTSIGENRRLIVGKDNKPVRQPVALANGVAKPAGQPPDALEFFVYLELDFMQTFGEVFTPGQA